MEVKRRKFQGVLNILSFNRHFYYGGVGVLLLIILICSFLKLLTVLNWVIIGLFSYGFFMPLLISAYVYDFSRYYDFHWLKDYKIQDSKENVMVNINAGFDETSFILKHNFPKSEIKVFDFYNAERHTEPAIVRARKVSTVYPNTKQIETNSIPLEDNSVNVVFLLSTAHEIRSNEEKVEFLHECHRICKPEGKVIMVEHLRDVPNFFAFSIGFTHFFSKKVWNHVFRRAQFSSFEERKFTPFMSIFCIQKLPTK